MDALKAQMAFDNLPLDEKDFEVNKSNREIITKIHIDPQRKAMIACNAHMLMVYPNSERPISLDSDALRKVNSVIPDVSKRQPTIVVNAEYLMQTLQFLEDYEDGVSRIEIFIEADDKAVVLRRQGSDKLAVLMPIKEKETA